MYVADRATGGIGKSPDEEPTLKRCTKCGVEKPLSAYGKQPGGRYGLHPRCKECRRAQERERYAGNRDEILAKQKAARPRKRVTELRRRRQQRYGLTPEQYEEMYDEQHGRCAICGERLAVLCVDHDHATGAIRGLLCSPCNLAVGFLRDDPARARAAALYLTNPPGSPPG